MDEEYKQGSGKFERLEVFLNVFVGFCKFGKVRKTEETLANFSEIPSV